jgi:hypothetical protein
MLYAIGTCNEQDARLADVSSRRRTGVRRWRVVQHVRDVSALARNLEQRIREAIQRLLALRLGRSRP